MAHGTYLPAAYMCVQQEYVDNAGGHLVEKQRRGQHLHRA